MCFFWEIPLPIKPHVPYHEIIFLPHLLSHHLRSIYKYYDSITVSSESVNSKSLYMFFHLYSTYITF
jgi:hypothetical protein